MKNVAPLIVLFFLATCSPSLGQASDWVTAPSFYTHDPASGQRTHQYSSPPASIANQTASFQTSGFRHYRSSLQFGRSADNYHRVEQWGPPVRPYGEWRFPYRPYSVPYDQWGAPYAGLNLGLGAGLGGFPVPVSPHYPGRDYPGRDYPGLDYPGRGGYPGQNPPTVPTNPMNPQPEGWSGGYPGYGDSGRWHGGWQGNWHGDRRPATPFYPPYPSEPYPSGPGFLYPVPPYADGYYPDDAALPRMNDREFFRKPTQGHPYWDNR